MAAQSPGLCQRAPGLLLSHLSGCQRAGRPVCFLHTGIRAADRAGHAWKWLWLWAECQWRPWPSWQWGFMTPGGQLPAWSWLSAPGTVCGMVSCPHPYWEMVSCIGWTPISMCVFEEKGGMALPRSWFPIVQKKGGMGRVEEEDYKESVSPLGTQRKIKVREKWRKLNKKKKTYNIIVYLLSNFPRSQWWPGLNRSILEALRSEDKAIP